MVPYADATIRVGTTGPLHFQAHLDVQSIPGILYDAADPNFSFDPTKVRIIATPHGRVVSNPPTHICAPSIRVENITDTQFDISAINTDTNAGDAGFDWMALSETPDPNPNPNRYELRMGLTQPQIFFPTNTFGDWCVFGVRLSSPLPASKLLKIPIRLLTGTNLGVCFGKTRWFENQDLLEQTDLSPQVFLGIDNPQSFQPQVFPVAVATDKFNPATDVGLSFLARNQDGIQGQCAFYYVCLGAPLRDVPVLLPKVFVESGTTPFLKEANKPGDIEGWHVYFSQPFLTPPVVLVTGNDKNGSLPDDPAIGPAHVVFQAQNVTPNGFTLAGELADQNGGVINADWVAIGCSQGCG